MDKIPVKFMPFHEALYNFKCVKCAEKLHWEANFDADGTTYHAECCNHTYHMQNANVRVSWEEI